MIIELPAAVQSMAVRGPDWARWVESLPALSRSLLADWRLTPDGPVTHGYCSLVQPVLTSDGVPAVLKIGFPDRESEHEHLALGRWNGRGAVRLLGADPHRRALLLERLRTDDLCAVSDLEACEIVAGLYRRIHIPAMPQLRSLKSYIDRSTANLAALPRNAPIPRRLVEEALSLSSDLLTDRDVNSRVLHSDLHYQNVLAADREPWLVIDPKPMNGDPHYEIAPMLWNRWDELAEDVRAGVLRRFQTLIDVADLDEGRARAWVVVRMVQNAMWSLHGEPQHDPAWLTTCISIAKAVSAAKFF